ncbi:hydrolethalus syndrome protein 1 homolog isoform X1 [Asterias rubens]|uniref:hydrolethalus syndrome protein 1 homolog isoform X1 n=1 Tax=Asterias rubens TaxID=7604 RepID=UPI001455A7D5|nr:hydrolethalus syndrome protein 1 homolog isoform X1 [Asterias rubens]XP_033636370.1 hydrolethalus syndrome protein 1 homolog isoform X1 [Asterias rubens]
MDDSLHFSENDVRQQLDALGYHNVPSAQLRQFARDLEGLIQRDTEGRSKSDEASTLASEIDYSSDDVSVPVRHPQGGSRRPTSAPTAPRARYVPSTKVQPNHPGSSRQPSYPAKHPQPFSYKYGDTSIANLDTTDESVSASGRQERRRSTGERKKPVKTAMKRKVVRKLNGQVQVFDESITESESGNYFLGLKTVDTIGEGQDVSDRLSRLALRQEEVYPEDVDEETTLTESDDASSLMGLVYSHRRPQLSRDLYSHRPAGDEDTVFKPHLPRSFIRPDSAQPRTKHDKKTDPVSRHQMYRAEWNSHRAPGEKNRNDLRWNIREQMMYKDTVTYPRRTPKVFSANNYVVPTDKKRQALRWAVRTSLAHKQMPLSNFE